MACCSRTNAFDGSESSHSVALGNLKLCGVLLAYAPPDMAQMLKTAMGWNFVSSELGAQINREIVALVEQGAVKPVIGAIVDFDALPAAMEAMANRQSTGRTIVMVP